MAELDIIEKAKNNSIIFTTAELNNPDVKGSFVYASPGFYQGDKKPTQTMSLGAIKLVLSDEEKFQNLMQVLNNPQVPTIRFGHYIMGDIATRFSCDKAVFAKLVMDLNLRGELSDIENIDEKLDIIVQLTTPKQLKESSEQFQTEIDFKPVSIPIKKLVMFFESGFKLYDFNKYPNLQFEGLSKDEFAYVLKEFAQKYNLFQLYTFSPASEKFYHDILNDNNVNTSQINEINETKDDYLESVKLNSQLVKHVFANLPQEFNDLEKAIYVYIKLCRTLTYDPEFFASNQKYSHIKHEDITYIEKITPENSQIVCYEFNKIYGKFLHMLNINFVTQSSALNSYGRGHEYLNFKANDMLIKADSVTSIIKGDLFNAKIDSPLVGLVCENKNREYRQKFLNALDKVYTHIKTNEPNPYIQKDSSSSWINLYTTLNGGKTFEVSMEEKLDILQTQLQRTQLPPVDKISYLKTLTSAIFQEEIEKHQMGMYIINEQTPNGKHYYTPTTVLSFNEDNINVFPSENTYYLCSAMGKIKTLSFSELEQLFAISRLGYINPNRPDHLIPGIIGGRHA